MGASSKGDRNKEVKVKPSDKSATVRYVRTEVDVNELVPPGVLDKSSAMIYKAHRKPSVSGAVASGIGKAEWKMEGKAFRVKNRARKVVEGMSPMEVVECYDEGDAEDEADEELEAVTTWESDASGSVLGNDTTRKGLEDGDIVKLKEAKIQVVSIPSGNTANLLKNWGGSKVNEELMNPNLELKMATNHMIRDNPNISVNEDTNSVNLEIDDYYVEKSRVVGIDKNEKKDIIKGNKIIEEFIPGVGFSFLNETREETIEKIGTENNQNQNMELDLSYLNKQVNWKEDGVAIFGSAEEDNEKESSEDESSKEGEIVMEERDNSKLNSEVNAKVSSGTVINSINFLPSLLGNANNMNKKTGNDQEKLKNSYAGVLKGNRHKGKIDVKFIPGAKREWMMDLLSFQLRS